MPSSHRFVLKDSHPEIVKEWIGDRTGITNNSSSNRSLLKNNPLYLLGDCTGLLSSITSHPKIRSGSEQQPQHQIQGRYYNTKCSLKATNGIRLHDMVMGIKFACMSIIDDIPNTLKNVGKSNPWQIYGMKHLIHDCYKNSHVLSSSGSAAPTSSAICSLQDVENGNKNNNPIMNTAITKEQPISKSSNNINSLLPSSSSFCIDDEIYLPLTQLMKKYFHLSIDHHMDYSGYNASGHVLDTQGYIGHNETTIVLSYRCTTSLKDWLTNLSTTSSAWETQDVINGHSGRFSGIKQQKQNLRVHTGFYNNFLSSVQAIQTYIDPILLDNATTTTPKTLYVTGHSLGGGIAHMALCYFLLEQQEKYQWETSPHRLVLVTAGSPRSYTSAMERHLHERIQTINRNSINTNNGSSSTSTAPKITIIRLVRDKDIVSHLPPMSIGYKHLNESENKLVYITKDEQILINPNLRHTITQKQYERALQRHPSIGSPNHRHWTTTSNGSDTTCKDKTKMNTDEEDDEENTITNELNELDCSNHSDKSSEERVQDDTGLLMRIKQKSVKWFPSTSIGTPYNDHREQREESNCDNRLLTERTDQTRHADSSSNNNTDTIASDYNTNVKTSTTPATTTKTPVDNDDEKKYQEMIRLVPRPVRDHMPEFYLKPLLSLYEIERTVGFVGNDSISTSSNSDGAQNNGSSSNSTLPGVIIMNNKDFAVYQTTNQTTSTVFEEDVAFDVVWNKNEMTCTTKDSTTRNRMSPRRTVMMKNNTKKESNKTNGTAGNRRGFVRMWSLSSTTRNTTNIPSNSSGNTTGSNNKNTKITQTFRNTKRTVIETNGATTSLSSVLVPQTAATN